MKRADTTEAAAALARLLTAIDRGEIQATAAERNAITSALIAVKEMAHPPIRGSR